MSRKVVLTSAVAVGIAITSAAFADGHLSREQEGAMNARKAHMQLYAFNLGPLVGMAQERIPYDADIASAAAMNLAALASVSQDRYWVEGTDSSVEGSAAKPEIWSDPEGFAAQLARMEETTTALSVVAGDGLDPMRAAFGAVGQTCGSCHEAYQVPRN